METMFWIWLAVAVVFLIFEIITPTLVFVCFVAGSVAAGLYAQWGPTDPNYYAQIGIFAVGSLILLPFTRRLAKKITKDAPELSNVDRMIGQPAIVTQGIDPDLGGKVRFEGEVWSATALEAIAADSKVRILALSGNRLRVEKLS